MLPLPIIAFILFFFFVLQVVQFAQIMAVVTFTVPVGFSSPSATNGPGVPQQIRSCRRRQTPT